MVIASRPRAPRLASIALVVATLVLGQLAAPRTIAPEPLGPRPIVVADLAVAIPLASSDMPATLGAPWDLDAAIVHAPPLLDRDLLLPLASIARTLADAL